MKRQINEHFLSDVINYFVKGYELKKGETITNYEFFIDQSKNKVFIVTYKTKTK